MYTLERAIIKENRQSGRWVETDLSSSKLSTLLTRYGDVYLYISWPGPGEGNLKGLYLRNAQEHFNAVDVDWTIQDWLDSIGNLTLPFEDDLIDGKARYVKYAQAWHCGYNAIPVGANAHVEADLPNTLKEDLYLTHESLDLKDFTKKALVTVNGLFHLCDREPKGVRVVGGGHNIYHAGDNQIGIYSFESIGDIRSYPITDEWIKKIRDDAPLVEGFYLRVPDSIETKNKSLMLVIGGYLHLVNDYFYEVAERVYRVNFNKIQLISRIYQTFKELNLTGLDVFRDNSPETIMNISTLNDDKFIKDYLFKTSSFFIVVDNPGVFQELRAVEYLRLPGRSLDVEQLQHPLVGVNGRMMDYHTIKEHGFKNDYHSSDQVYVLCSTLNPRSDYDNFHRPYRPDGLIDNGRYPYRPFKHEKYFYRIIGSEV